MRATFDTDGLPPADRVAALDDLFTGGDHPMGVRCREPEGFHASVRALDLAAVNVVELTATPSDVVRTAAMVRRADPELLSVLMATSGRLVLTQSGRETALEPSDIALYDSSRPFGLRIGAEGRPATLVRAHIPRVLVGQSADAIGRLTARRLPEQSPFAGLLAHLLGDLAGGPAGCRPGDLPRLAAVTQELLRGLVAHLLDAESDLPEESGRRTLLLTIEAYVRRNLHDPDLSPRVIAGAHHLSVGYLHRLFGARETTVAGWIRRLRLEGASRDLRDQALRDVPVHRIATRWGFKDHSTFTRTFRAAYGTSPRDYRHAPVTVS